LHAFVLPPLLLLTVPAWQNCHGRRAAVIHSGWARCGGFGKGNTIDLDGPAPVRMALDEVCTALVMRNCNTPGDCAMLPLMKSQPTL
jgi:hypothetical protein